MLVVIGRSSLTAILEVEAATAGAPTMGLTGELGAVATAAAEATRTATSLAPHVSVSTPARKSKNYGARRPPRQATTTTSLPSLRDFATYSS
jgi:microcompartment protein CcmL/EutN